MDFGAEDIGPYDPYMDFSLENIGRATQTRPYEEKSGGHLLILQNLTKTCQIFKKVLSTMSNSLIFTKIQIIGNTHTIIIFVKHRQTTYTIV